MNGYTLILLRAIAVSVLNTGILLVLKLPFIPAVQNFYNAELNIIDRKTGVYNLFDIIFQHGVEFDVASVIILAIFIVLIPIIVALLTARYHLVWEKSNKYQGIYSQRTSIEKLMKLVKVK